MPYKYKKIGNKYVVYKKSGKRVGATAGNKEALRKYLAALHINAKENTTMTKEQILREYIRAEIRKSLKEEKADKDYDNDGEVESPEAEFKGSRDKAIKKAMKKDTMESYTKSLEEIASKWSKLSKKINEVDTPPNAAKGGVLPSQSDAENIEIMSADVKKVRTLLANLYKDLQDAYKDNKGAPSVYLDAYGRLLMAMVPITSALLSAQYIGGSLKQGSIDLGSGSKLQLQKSVSSPKPTPPPTPPPVPKVQVPPVKKLPPVPPPPPGKKSVPPPPPPRK